MTNNIPNENELPEFDPTEYGGDELGRCKSYLKKTVKLLEEECKKSAEWQSHYESSEDYIEELQEQIESFKEEIEELKEEIEMLQDELE